MIQDAAALAAKYQDNSYMTQVRLEMAVLDRSYALVQKHETALAGTFAMLAELYADATAIAESPVLSGDEKRHALYRIYDMYFACLAPLPYTLRAKVKAHKYMRQMNAVVKKGNAGADSAAFWREFFLKCGTSAAVFFTAEIVLLFVLDEGAALWLRVLLWAVFGVSMAIYVYYSFALEGRRLFVGLQKWLGFKTKPAEFNKPMDIWQYAKLAAPLGIAVLGALVKVYIQQA